MRRGEVDRLGVVQVAPEEASRPEGRARSASKAEVHVAVCNGFQLSLE